jgi:hypothetical protein
VLHVRVKNLKQKMPFALVQYAVAAIVSGALRAVAWVTALLTESVEKPWRRLVAMLLIAIKA